MVGARGDALEWAIALARSPAERTTLRQRALPEGIERLLQVAAGISGEPLADMVTRTDEDAASIVEAARFYAREILLYRGADAYRVLGLDRNASQGQVKTHHRLLQQWLHPDRQSSDWDAIFAARVNEAWGHLRSEDRRLSYDQANPPRQGVDSPLVHGTPWLHQVQAGAAPDLGARWRRRVPVLALIGVCAVLGLAALRDQREPIDQVADEQDDRSVGQLPAHLGLKLPELGNARVERIAKQPQRKTAAQNPSVNKPTAVAKQSLPPNDRINRLITKAIAAPSPVTSILKPVAAGTKVKVDAAVATADRPGESRVAASIPNTPVATAATPSKAKPVVVPASPVARVNPSVAVAATRLETGDSKAQPSPQPSAKPASAAPAIQIQRVQQAQGVGDRLIAFMSQPAAKVPPIWNSLTTQRGASLLRDDLHGDGVMRIANPHWRVGDEIAAMRADVVYPDGEPGRLSANLVWRGEHWLVSGLTLERDL